jgi:hypothetical protein
MSSTEQKEGGINGGICDADGCKWKEISVMRNKIEYDIKFESHPMAHFSN